MQKNQGLHRHYDLNGSAPWWAVQNDFQATLRSRFHKGLDTSGKNKTRSHMKQWNFTILTFHWNTGFSAWLNRNTIALPKKHHKKNWLVITTKIWWVFFTDSHGFASIRVMAGPSSGGNLGVPWFFRPLSGSGMLWDPFHSNGRFIVYKWGWAPTTTYKQVLGWSHPPRIPNHPWFFFFGCPKSFLNNTLSTGCLDHQASTSKHGDFLPKNPEV